MKTPEVVETKLHRLYEMLNDLHFVNIGIDEDNKVSIVYYDRWKERLHNYMINILIDWGKELCEEQKCLCSASEIKSSMGTHPIGAILDAPLPTILTQQ